MHEHRRRPAEKLVENVGACGGIGGGREGDRLHIAELRLHRAERCVFRTEVVAPLRDAMRLVDCEQRDPGAFEEIERLGFHQSFGRDVKEAQLAARDLIEGRPIVGGIVGGVERGSRNAVTAKLRDLIAHQRDQRRHHDGQAVAQQRRELVAQRFAAAGRHHREHIAAVQDRGHDLILPRSEGFEAKSGAKDRSAAARSGIGHRIGPSAGMFYLCSWNAARNGKRAMQENP